MRETREELEHRIGCLKAYEDQARARGASMIAATFADEIRKLRVDVDALPSEPDGHKR